MAARKTLTTLVSIYSDACIGLYQQQQKKRENDDNGGRRAARRYEIRDEEKGDLRSGDIINIFRYDELYNK